MSESCRPRTKVDYVCSKYVRHCIIENEVKCKKSLSLSTVGLVCPKSMLTSSQQIHINISRIRV